MPEERWNSCNFLAQQVQRVQAILVEDICVVIWVTHHCITIACAINQL